MEHQAQFAILAREALVRMAMESGQKKPPFRVHGRAAANALRKLRLQLGVSPRNAVFLLARRGVYPDATKDTLAGYWVIEEDYR